MAVPGVAGAPVLGAEGGEGEALEGAGLAPGELEDVREAVRAAGDEAPGAGGGDDGGVLVGEGGEGWAVEVVVVGVGDEDEVGAWEFVGEGDEGGESAWAQGASEESQRVSAYGSPF